jgi:hypothetical protein
METTKQKVILYVGEKRFEDGKVVEEVNTTLIGTIEQIKKVIEIMDIKMYRLIDDETGDVVETSKELIQAKEIQENWHDTRKKADKRILNKYNGWLESQTDKVVASDKMVSIKVHPRPDFRYGRECKGDILYELELWLLDKSTDIYVLSFITRKGTILAQKFTRQLENKGFTEVQIKSALACIKKVPKIMSDLVIDKRNKHREIVEECYKDAGLNKEGK